MPPGCVLKGRWNIGGRGVEVPKKFAAFVASKRAQFIAEILGKVRTKQTQTNKTDTLTSDKRALQCCAWVYCADSLVPRASRASPPYRER